MSRAVHGLTLNSIGPKLVIMILLVHAHPDPESFTAALSREIASALTSSGQEVTSVDLYRVRDPEENRPPRSAAAGDTGTSGEGRAETVGFFPPVLELEELRRKSSLDTLVQKQMTLVENAVGYVVVHPDWWGGPPAVLKGWVDRVLRPSTAYEIPDGFGLREPAGLLAGRRALVVVTGDADGPGPLAEFWENRVWGFCGARAELLYFPRIGESSRESRLEFARKSARRALIRF